MGNTILVLKSNKEEHLKKFYKEVVSAFDDIAVKRG